MNMNKVKDFTKKYGFYLAVGLVSVGAITAVIMTSYNEDSQVAAQAQPSAPESEDRLIDDVNPMDSIPVDSQYDESDMIKPNEEPAVSEPVSEKKDADDEMVAETFNSTTADSQQAPFFAEGDTLLLPVEGKLVVPYTDDSTKHWYSDALEQTMRTFGIAISAEQGESIKAPATAKVVDVIADSTTLDSTKYVGNVGQVIVMDLGNGYTCKIGVEGGSVSKDLIGQVVLAGQEIGVAGSGTGPFAGADGSVYVQLQHDGQTIDPTDMFAFKE
ncbi:MAG: peptidoglycan DD-metalloendopeptidase family protein [Cellulosilyticaceae bacterium]